MCRLAGAWTAFVSDEGWGISCKTSSTAATGGGVNVSSTDDLEEELLCLLDTFTGDSTSTAKGEELG